MKQRLLISAATMFLMAALPAQAQLFGPSDEQVAHEKEQDSLIRANADAIQQADRQAQQGQQQLQAQIRDLQDRVRNLTDSLARATGANEELGFQLRQMDNRMTQQERDFAYRLYRRTDAFKKSNEREQRARPHQRYGLLGPVGADAFACRSHCLPAPRSSPPPR